MASEDAEDDAFTLELSQLQVRPRERDRDWQMRRRELHGRRCEALENRKVTDTEEQLRFARKIRAQMASWEGHEGPMDKVDLAEFTARALVLLDSKEKPEEQQEQRFPAKEEIGVKGETAVSSQGGREGHNARDLYAAYFFPDSVRAASDGSYGASYREVPIEPEQERWSDDQWAKRFLLVGGFEPSAAGAAAEDEDGWLALHHAIQSTVHWSYGIAACRGLIDMMPPDRLQAKTRGGRTVGYTALHFAANGSDKMMERHSIVRLLLEREADVNALDNAHRTPLHLAAGTGVLDSAEVLVEARADLEIRDKNGKNAFDKCVRSSGQMTKCPPPSLLPSPASVTVLYSRHEWWRSM